ncbi:MAG: HDOD domain-containing protein [Armatimonadetes bacterium]|nr:HDOD domain-containing protein [Armatimonadota bacterium]
MISSRLGKGVEGVSVPSVLGGIGEGARQCLQNLSALAHLYGNRPMAERALSQDARLIGQVCGVLSGGLVGEPGVVYQNLTQAFDCHGCDDVVFAAQFVRACQLADLTSAKAGLDPDAFVRHAVATSAGTAHLAQQEGADPAEARMAGLLHNVGVLLLAGSLQGRYGAVLTGLAGAGLALHEAEVQSLGFDHQAVGGAALAQYAFPSTASNGASAHHGDISTMAADIKRVAVAASVAHQLGNTMGICDACPPLQPSDIGTDETGMCGIAEAAVLAAGRVDVVLAKARTKCA